MERFTRTEMLLGSEHLKKLKNSRIAVIGLGGVGSYSLEAVARAGVGKIDLFDGDVVDLSNVNRQLIALDDTVGQAKVDVAAHRINLINPDCAVSRNHVFLNGDTVPQIDFSAYDYIIDAIDTISAKILIARGAFENGTPIISCMSTGNKLDPSKFKIDDIFNTSICPIARIMRHELRSIGVKRLKVLYSTEMPRRQTTDTPRPAEAAGVRRPPASISFVPSVAGLMIAGEVIRDITGLNE